MTAPTLEPLSEEELAWLDREKQAGATIVGRLLAEVRAHRAAALSEEDRVTLEYMQREFCDRQWSARAYGEVLLANKQERCIKLLDRLLGRSAT